ncbi:MAG TPA: glycosyltransferase family 4 protein [Oligoflexia bacterium]|nr:glycosyltransferase family 4 protein [Oligoflexia bacterium]
MEQKKYKVLHLITRLIVGGAQDNTLITVRALDRSRYTVHLAANPDGDWCERAIECADAFFPLRQLRNPINPLRDFCTLAQMVMLMKRQNYDIVHTHSSKAGLLGCWAAKIARVPVVVHTIHGFPFHDFMPAWKRHFFIALERGNRATRDFVITLSERDRAEAARLDVSKWDKSKTIYSGIDYSVLEAQGSTKDVKQSLGIPGDWQVICMVARLDYLKAPQLLLEAFARISVKHPHTILLLAGDGDLRPALERQAQQLRLNDRIRLLGTRNDIPDLLRAADIFAISSLSEAMGRAMIEATLLGRAVIAPATGGIPEIIKEMETGLLFTPGNIDELADRLDYLLTNRSEQIRLGENARNANRQIFDASTMVQQIEAVYSELLALN